MKINTQQALGISKAEFERQVKEARKRGEESLKYDPRAVSAKYQKGRITVGLSGGWSFTFDPRMYKAFRNATDKELAEVRPMGLGFTLEWENLDQHLGVGPLILDLIGDKYLATELGRRNGAAKTEKKSKASRVNGKLGGRPKKTTKS
jgi:hypothetical protein